MNGQTPNIPDGMSADEMRKLLHEMQVHQIELEEQNKQLRDSQTQLEVVGARFADLYDCAPVAYFALNRQGVMTRMNQAGAYLLGCEHTRLHTQVPQKRFETFLIESHRPTFNAFLKQVFATGTRQSGEVELMGKAHSGQAIQIEASLSANGLECHAVMVDITRRKRTEDALRLSEQRMEQALDAAKASVWEWVLDSHRTDWFDSLRPLYGLSPALREPSAQAWKALIHPNDLDRVTTTIQGAAAAGQECECYWRFNLPTGEPERWLMLRGRPVTGASGKPERYIGIVIDMTERKRAQAERDEHEARLRLFIDHAPAALAMFDSEMRYLAVSRSWMDDFGLGDGDIIGQCHYKIFPEIPAHWREVHRRGLAGEVIRAAEDPFERNDGTIQWIRWEVRPWYQGDGTVGGIVIFSEDITQRKHAEAILRDADRRKDEFLAMLAHELRNPLAPIRNAAHILGLLDTAEPQVRWAQSVIEQQVNHLTRLVDDMLEVSRIIRGKITLKLDAIDFNVLATRVIADMRPLIDAKGHQFHLDLPPESLWLRGDMVRLSQVLVNLIENAIKYTPDHGCIRLSAIPGEDEIEVVVEDNGMGIAADLLPHVFDLFQQGERTLDRAEGGLGLGLSLVRSLVQAHGGRVIAESHGQGCGTRMRLWLPRSSTAPASRPERSAERSGSDTNPTPRRILVVDDEEAVANSTALLLTLAGNLVQIARSGPEAIQVAGVFQPEVVLLDIGLGSMNGYEVAHELRAGPGGQALCLIAVSGYGDAKSQERARTAGFDHYLIKPVEPGQLKQLLLVLKARPAWAE